MFPDHVQESDGDIVVLILVEDGQVTRIQGFHRLEILGHPGRLLLFGEFGDFLDHRIEGVDGLVGIQVILRQAGIVVGTRQRAVGETHLHGHAVIDHEGTPAGTVGIDAEEGVLGRPAFHLEHAALDDGTVDGLVTEFVDETDHDAVFGTGALHDILHSFLGAGGRHHCEDGGSKKH